MKKKIIGIIISIICIISLVFNSILYSKIEEKEEVIKDYQNRLNLCGEENKDLLSIKEGLLEENTNYQKAIGELTNKVNSCESELKK